MMRGLRGLLTICLLALPTLSHAAIAFVSVTDAPNTNSVSSVTQSVVVPVMTKGIMLVCSTVRGNTPVNATAGTFNGAEALTFLQRDTGQVQTELWYLVNPTATTANVVMTYASTGNNFAMAFSVLLLSGVNQSTPIDVHSGSHGNGPTLSTILTTVANSTWAADCSMGTSNAGITVGAGQTARANRIIGSSVDGVGMSTINGQAIAGAETLSWTQAAGQDWAISAVSLVPDVAAAPATSAPSQATVRWTNGTDAVGVTGSILRRCTTPLCTPLTTLTTVAGTNLQAQTYVDPTTAVNTTYGYSIANFDAAGNTSTYIGPVYITTGSTFRNILASDTFDRADNADLGATWDNGYTGDIAAQIVSNRVRTSAVGAVAAKETYNGVSTPNDQFAQITVPTITGAVQTNVGVLVRFANSPTVTGYVCQIQVNPLQSRIGEYTAGAFADLVAADTTTTWNPTDILRCEAQGTALRLYKVVLVNGVEQATLVLSATDASNASGKTGIYIFMITSGVISNVELDTFSMGSITSTAPVAPSIATLVLTATNATVTYGTAGGAVPPTSIQVCSNPSTLDTCVTEPIANFPGGVYTHTWLPGTTYACFKAIDALGVLNSAGYQCGIPPVSALDIIPPIMSNGLPSATLPAGTTSATMSLTTDGPATCRWDTTDLAYAFMANLFTAAALTQSATVSSLSNGTTTKYYARCSDTLGNTNLTSLVITVVVSNSTADVTPPTNVTNLVASAISQSQVSLTWTPATDASGIFGNQVYMSLGAGNVTYLPVNATGAANATVPNIPPGVVANFVVKAIDNVQNYSALNSNVATVTMPGTLDFTPPSVMTNLYLVSATDTTMLLVWDPLTDNSGLVTASIEQCQGVGCTWQSVKSGIASTFFVPTSTPSTQYCFRGKGSDPSGNVSGAYSNVTCGMTTAPGDPPTVFQRGICPCRRSPR